jgi:hypothetical protein
MEAHGDACDHRAMHLPRTFELTSDARAAVAQLVGIMSDQVMDGADAARWEYEELLRLEQRFEVTMGVDDLGRGPSEGVTVTVGMEDVALLLDGMAYTEVMSAEFAWIDMVRWTADFITTELRGHWTDEEWREFSAAGARRFGW